MKPSDVYIKPVTYRDSIDIANRVNDWKQKFAYWADERWIVQECARKMQWHTLQDDRREPLGYGNGCSRIRPVFGSAD